MNRWYAKKRPTKVDEEPRPRNRRNRRYRRRKRVWNRKKPRSKWKWGKRCDKDGFLKAFKSWIIMCAHSKESGFEKGKPTLWSRPCDAWSYDVSGCVSELGTVQMSLWVWFQGTEVCELLWIISSGIHLFSVSNGCFVKWHVITGDWTMKGLQICTCWNGQFFWGVTLVAANWWAFHSLIPKKSDGNSHILGGLCSPGCIRLEVRTWRWVLEVNPNRTAMAWILPSTFFGRFHHLNITSVTQIVSDNFWWFYNSISLHLIHPLLPNDIRSL